jgi:thioredoxin 1
MAPEYEGRIRFGKVNAFESYETAGRFGVAGLPTVVLLNNGETLGQASGMQQRADVEALLARAL